MKLTKIGLIAMLGVMVMAVLLVSCKSNPTPAGSFVPGISVGITDGICPNVTINAGDQVTWTNQGKSDHVVRDMPASGAGEFDSGTIGPGNSFAYVFPQANTYTYTCSEDGTMTGIITVNP